MQTILQGSRDINTKSDRQKKLSLHAIEFLAAFGAQFRLSLQLLDLEPDVRADLTNTIDHILLSNVSYMNLHDIVQMTYFLRQQIELQSGSLRSQKNLTIVSTDLLEGIKSKFMENVQSYGLSREKGGHQMTLMLYNYLKLGGCMSALDKQDTFSTHGELLNLVATQILVRKIDLDLESITFLLQSLRQLQTEKSLKISKHVINKHVPELRAYALSQLDVNEVQGFLEQFKETSDSLSILE